MKHFQPTTHPLNFSTNEIYSVTIQNAEFISRLRNRDIFSAAAGNATRGLQGIGNPRSNRNNCGHITNKFR